MSLKLENSIFYKNLRVLYDINFPRTDDSHSAIIEAIFKALDMVSGDIDTAKLAMSLSTAEGEWLDIWGDYFGIPRDPGEEDDDYRRRIIEEILSPKVTLRAIKRAAIRWLKRFTGNEYTEEQISIFEPWRGLLMPSYRGQLSNDFYLWSEDYWTHAVIDISLPNPAELTPELIEYLLWIKAAGVKIVWSNRTDYDVIQSYTEEPKAYADLLFTRDILVNNKPHTFRLDEIDSKLSDSIDKLLSGSQEVIQEYLRYWGVMYAWKHLKEHWWSPYWKWEDMTYFFNKPNDEITLQELFELEAQDEISPNQLTHYMWHIELEVISLINIYTTFVNNTRDLDGSPILRLLIDLGYENYPSVSPYLYLLQTYMNTDVLLRDFPDKTVDTLTLQDMINWEERNLTQKQMNFIYPDWYRSYAKWLSYKHIADVVGQDPSTITLSWMSENVTPMVDALIWEEARIDNVMAPVEITTEPI